MVQFLPTVNAHYCRCRHAHPYTQILTLQPPQNHTVGYFYSFKLESRYVHGKPAEHKGFTSQEGERQFLTDFFNTQMFPGPVTHHWKPAYSCRCRWGPTPSAPPVQLVIWAKLSFGPEMHCLVLWLVLWRNRNPFLGQCRILELFRLETPLKDHWVQVLTQH